MNIDSVNKWLTLAAHAGVIASIVFLAIEVNQNQTEIEEANRLSVLEVFDKNTDRMSTIRALIASNEEVAEIWERGMAGAQLTPVETVRFNAVCQNFIYALLQRDKQYRQLTGDLEFQAARMTVRNSIERSVNYRQCWDQTKGAVADFGDNEFVYAVDQILE